MGELALDSSLALNAGADTTASALVFLLFFLIGNPHAYTRVKAEIFDSFPNGSTVNDVMDCNLKFTEACM